MGSHSVYCGLSNITINEGRNEDVVLIPLKVEKYYKTSYNPHTLPIYCKYFDYGGVFDIVEDVNTSIIEEYYGMDIQDFCNKVTGDHGEDERFYGIEHMFIKREIYDWLSSRVKNHHHTWFPMGSEEMMTLMGGVYKGESDTETRYKHIWELQDKNLHTDGTWIKGGIYNIDGLIENGFTLTPEVKEIKDKLVTQCWRIFSSVNLMNIFGYTTLFRPRYIRNHRNKKELLENIISSTYGDFHKEYYKRLDDIGDEIARFLMLRDNIHYSSNALLPIHYGRSPQLAVREEYEEHLAFAEKVVELLKNEIEKKV